MSIHSKIAAIIAKADSTTHPEEAAAFMAKAQAMLEKHGISLLELGRMGEDPIGVDKDITGHSASYPWMVRVADALVKYYGCNFVRFKRGNRITYSVAGRESARITFTLMLPFVERQVKAWGRQAFNDGVYNSRMKAVTRIGNATAVRIWQLCRETPRAEGEGINALVPVDLIKQALQEAFPDSKQPRKTKVTVDHYATNKAQELNLNSQVPAPEGAARLV